jgi:hypothetical protein
VRRASHRPRPPHRWHNQGRRCPLHPRLRRARQIYTESRDEIYTTQRNDACYRFDAVINSFCGGDVSGVQDITDRELDDVRKRMQSILNTIRFDN